MGEPLYNKSSEIASVRGGITGSEKDGNIGKSYRIGDRKGRVYINTTGGSMDHNGLAKAG